MSGNANSVSDNDKQQPTHILPHGRYEWRPQKLPELLESWHVKLEADGKCVASGSPGCLPYVLDRLIICSIASHTCEDTLQSKQMKRITIKAIGKFARHPPWQPFEDTTASYSWASEASSSPAFGRVQKYIGNDPEIEKLLSDRIWSRKLIFVVLKVLVQAQTTSAADFAINDWKRPTTGWYWLTFKVKDLLINGKDGRVRVYRQLVDQTERCSVNRKIRVMGIRQTCQITQKRVKTMDLPKFGLEYQDYHAMSGNIKQA